MNTNPPLLPQNAPRKGIPHNASKALFIVAVATAAVGVLATVIAASVFVMPSATALVSAIGYVCFWGCLPVLFLSGLFGLAALVFWYRGRSGKP